MNSDLDNLSYFRWFKERARFLFSLLLEIRVKWNKLSSITTAEWKKLYRIVICRILIRYLSMKMLSRYHVIAIKWWNKAGKFVVDFLPRSQIIIRSRCSDHAPFNLTFRELSVASELDLRNLNGYGQEILSWRFSSRFDTLLPCRIVKYICYRAQFAIQRWNVENGKGKISITVFRGPKISSTLVAWKGFKREILYVERSYGTDEMKRDKHFRQTNFIESSLMNFYASVLSSGFQRFLLRWYARKYECFFTFILSLEENFYSLYFYSN